jgi:hypothetical protein
MNYFYVWTEVNELAELIRFLQSGQRMEKPELMPRVIGNVMADCWKHNQEERLTFAQLEEILGEMVTPIIRQRFAGAEEVEETNNYMQMNKETDEPSNTGAAESMPDYLRMNSTGKREDSPPSNAPTSSQPPNVPLKLYPKLSVTNYINTSTEINTPPQTPMAYANIGGHAPLSPTESLADTNYLAMLPAGQV